MNTLRYLLMVTAVMGVLSVSAQTPKYGTTYNPGNERAAYDRVQVSAQMPEATMGSISSEFMTSGSALPQAAVTGTSTTFDNTSSGRPGNIRRGWGTGGESGEPGDRPEPYETPIGDATWPLLMLAAAYALLRVYKRKRGV